MAINQVSYFPNIPNVQATVANQTTNALTASTHKAGMVYKAWQAKSIRKIHFRTGTVTTGDTVDCRVETVDTATDGNPTGTLFGTTTNGSCVVASSDDNVWKEATLTADAALAIGDTFALIVANGGGGGSMNLVAFDDMKASVPYGAHFTASWAKQVSPIMIVPEYSDGTFGIMPGLIGGVGSPLTATAFNSGSAVARRGNIFQVATSKTAIGAWCWVDGDNDFTMKLYDSGGTELATTGTILGLQRPGTTAGLYFIPFTTAYVLAASTSYRIAIVPGASSVESYEFDVPAAAAMDLFDGGQSCHASVFTTAGSSWAETTTRRNFCGVILEDIVASGGGPVSTNMRGGFAN